jgi:hypothetical protein
LEVARAGAVGWHADLKREKAVNRSNRAGIVVVAAVLTLCPSARGGAQPLPTKMSDKAFWAMVVGFSEDGGSFVSDNIISNEIEYQHAIPELQIRKPGGVYLGVGPEQNFTYIASLKPSMAFVLDIRRENLLLHLAYKALMESSVDRVDFMSHMFARKPPEGLGRDSTARALFDAFAAVPASEELAQATERTILDCLERIHGFLLGDDDRRGIKEVYRSLHVSGPNGRGDFGGGSWIPSYAELMAQTDLRGHNHSFVESERNFQTLKEYESNNLIVPLVGDFAGSKAIRAVGSYVKDHHAAIVTFYASNVEEYLFKGGTWQTFFENVSTLPIDRDSMFIRTFFTHSNAGLRTLLDPIAGCLTAVTHGEIRAYTDLIARSREPKP